MMSSLNLTISISLRYMTLTSSFLNGSQVSRYSQWFDPSGKIPARCRMLPPSWNSYLWLMKKLLYMFSRCFLTMCLMMSSTCDDSLRSLIFSGYGICWFMS